MTDQRYNTILKELKTAYYQKARGKRDHTPQILDTLSDAESATLFNRVCALYGKGMLFKLDGGPAQIHRMNTYRHIAETMRHRHTDIHDYDSRCQCQHCRNKAELLDMARRGEPRPW